MCELVVGFGLVLLVVVTIITANYYMINKMKQPILMMAYFEGARRKVMDS